jgi:hypothetical protein
VAALGMLFESEDQKFFLVGVFTNAGYRLTFLRNGAFLAFIPVFFESCFWMFELYREESRLGGQPESKADDPRTES